MTTHATITIEIDLHVSGTVIPGEPTCMPNASDDVGDPGFDTYVEGLGIDDITSDRPAFEPNVARRIWVTHHLLEGVDTTGSDVQRLLSNLLELVRDDAAEAVIEAE